MSRDFMKTLFLSLVLLAGTVSATAQQPAAPLPAADPGTDTFKWIYAAILKPRCITCHQTTPEAGSLASYDNIKSLVAPGDPQKSYFYLVLGNGTNCTMPAGNNAKCIGGRGLRAVFWWIKKGASAQ